MKIIGLTGLLVQLFENKTQNQLILLCLHYLTLSFEPYTITATNPNTLWIPLIYLKISILLILYLLLRLEPYKTLTNRILNEGLL